MAQFTRNLLISASIGVVGLTGSPSIAQNSHPIKAPLSARHTDVTLHKANSIDDALQDYVRASNQASDQEQLSRRTPRHR